MIRILEKKWLTPAESRKERQSAYYILETNKFLILGQTCDYSGMELLKSWKNSMSTKQFNWELDNEIIYIDGYGKVKKIEI